MDGDAYNGRSMNKQRATPNYKHRKEVVQRATCLPKQAKLAKEP